MQIPLLDLKAQYSTIREDVRAAIDEVCDAQWFILGPNVQKLESEVAAYCGVPTACGVSSGTDALLLCLMLEGVGPGDEVITTPYTFFGTVGSIVRVGATPVFVDIDPGTFNLDPGAIEAKITPRTKAILPVHLYGQMADMDPIMAAAERHGLLVIEDACQAIGAEYKGRRAGSVGHFGCFSFFPSKNLGGFGDGGMVVSPLTGKKERLDSFRNHGMDPKYYHSHVGGNFRLDALQAVVLSAKLPHLDAWTAAREANADDYARLFAESPAAASIRLPVTAASTSRHVFNQFCVRLPAERRDAVRDGLRALDIGCEIYYPVPLHLQECFAFLGHKQGDFPNSEAAAAESLALPIYPELTHAQRETIVRAVGDLLR